MTDAEVRAYVVWLPILDKDDEEAAAEAASSIVDPRVTHHWNPDKKIARAVSKALGTDRERAVAWDVFLVYGPDVAWNNGPEMPAPTEWMHRYTTKEDFRWMRPGQLESALRTSLGTLLQPGDPVSSP